jgi:acetyl esterase/lipase
MPPSSASPAAPHDPAQHQLRPDAPKGVVEDDGADRGIIFVAAVAHLERQCTPKPERPATLLYLHGGGYVLGSAFGYRPLVGALAAAA